MPLLLLDEAEQVATKARIFTMDNTAGAVDHCRYHDP